MLPYVVRRNTLLPLFHLRHLRDLFSSSSSVAAVGTPSPGSHFMVEYLVKSCGLSAAEASKASKSLAHLQSTEKPDAVLTFMRLQGFDGAHLRKMISWIPKFLCWNVEKNLAPKFRFFCDMGFSDSDLVDIIMSNPGIITRNIHSLRPQLEIWENLFGSRELLLKHLKISKKRRFLGHSIEKRVLPNLSFLRDECGIPEERVSLVVRKHPDFIVIKPATLQALVVRAEELGMPRHSTLLLWAVTVLYLVSKENIESKIKLMKSLGWSDSEFSAAFRKAPKFLCFSQKELLRKMEFLVKEVGYTPSCIAHQPTILLYSLEKRVIPRFRVMEMLKSKGLWTTRCKLLSFVSLTDTRFMNFVLRYKERVPELLHILRIVTGL